jgi:hypothetical protein
VRDHERRRRSLFLGQHQKPCRKLMRHVTIERHNIGDPSAVEDREQQQWVFGMLSIPRGVPVSGEDALMAAEPVHDRACNKCNVVSRLWICNAVPFGVAHVLSWVTPSTLQARIVLDGLAPIRILTCGSKTASSNSFVASGAAGAPKWMR